MMMMMHMIITGINTPNKILVLVELHSAEAAISPSVLLVVADPPAIG